MNNQKDLQKEIKEYIVSCTEEPSDVIKDVSMFIDRIMSRNSYAIFQSDFAFMNGDIPFTMIVETELNGFKISYWAWDWTTFQIQKDDYIHVADTWKPSNRLNEKIPNIETLTAKEVVEHDNCWDSAHCDKTCCDANCLAEAIYVALANIYGLNDDIPDDEWDEDPITSGIVAVIYREPLK